MHTIVIRYSEIGLKGKNRNWFESLLMKNIRKHLKKHGKNTVSRIHGRIILESDAELNQIKSVLPFIPGIANFSVTVPCTHDQQELAEQAQILVGSYLAEQKKSAFSFKVSARRSFKGFPLNSMQLSAQLGGDVLQKYPDLKVKLTHPEIELGVEIWPKNRSILYLEQIPSQGGLPVGSSGNVISFLSGGIDSPVSSWFMMKRGCHTTFIHFHSFPFIGEQSRQKVIDLVTHLSRYQPKSTLVIIPFAEIQKAIRTNCEEKNRTILYRRMMYRVAEKLKDRYKAIGYVTGEAVGQVASQTLENLACTQAVTTLPIIRPLIGMDKAEIIAQAKKIGSFSISIQPFPDCCTVFQPKKPEIHGKVSDIDTDEKNIDIESLLSSTLENLETIHFETQVLDQFWE